MEWDESQCSEDEARFVWDAYCKKRYNDIMNTAVRLKKKRGASPMRYGLSGIVCYSTPMLLGRGQQPIKLIG